MQAYVWFDLAATAGDKDAGEKRDILAGTMTSQQIGAAQKLAQEWRMARSNLPSASTLDKPVP